MSATQVIATVRWRFRICNYLFKASAAWMLFGGVGMIWSTFKRSESDVKMALITLLIGCAIQTCAVALTLAIYRCPICDAYISRFRPNKALCGSCGVRIR